MTVTFRTTATPPSVAQIPSPTLLSDTVPPSKSTSLPTPLTTTPHTSASLTSHPFLISRRPRPSTHTPVPSTVTRSGTSLEPSMATPYPPTSQPR